MAKKITKKLIKTTNANVKNKKSIINVKNLDETPDTSAELLVKNKIKYEPKVSVIIPVYNAADYLRECLDSVCGQTLKDIEIICIDDGSSDNSLEILKEYAKKDNRIIVAIQENSGAGIARNCGLSIAKGDFVAFMDPDDYYPSENTLKKLYDTALENNVKICGGTMNRLKDGQNIVADEYLFEKYGLVEYVDYQFDYGYTRFIYNRKLLADNNILFPDYLRQQDPVFFVGAMIAAGKFYAINEPTYVYRVAHTGKQIEWTKRKCVDVAKSLRDLLVLSDRAGLVKLHRNMADRVIYPYFVNVFKKLVDANGVPDENLIRLLEALNYKMIYAENPVYQFPWFYKSNPNLCRISVIIPVYNVEKYLAQCLDSVINQTYKNLEIVCVNDGSTDGSLQILEQYAKRDNRIKIISQKNAGLNGARNTGLRNATGMYITFLDSDDWIDADWVEKAYHAALNNNADMVKSGYMHYWEDKVVPDGINKTIDAKASQGKFLAVNENNIIACATLYDKAFIEKNNLYFDPEIRKHEDILYTLKATFLANKIVPLSGTYLNYRRASSILSQFNKGVYGLLPVINDKAITMLNSWDCDKSDYIAAVKRLWWRTDDVYSKRNQVEDITAEELQDYLDKNYAVFKNVRWPYDIFDADTIKKLGIVRKSKNALLVEINDCHGECLPGYCKYLLDLGYNVDVLVNTVLKNENPMYMFDGHPCVNTRFMSDKDILNFLNSRETDRYDVCLFNSNILYNEYHLQSVLNFINVKNMNTHVMCVEHRLDNLPELTSSVNALVLKKFYNQKNTFEVNPHYFGRQGKHNKNKIVNFVVAGNIQKARKNFDLLINSVNYLVDKNITDFKITVIGGGKLDGVPENIKAFFDVKGRLSYPDLYRYVSEADFFMTLLDPDLKEHDRYVKSGTSGSFQLIYGLNIPCLIASKFAKAHHFTSKNSVCYDKNSEISSAMIKCINMTDDEYIALKDNLKKLADGIYQSSLENLKKAINKKSKRLVLVDWVSLPYYAIANVFMKYFRLPYLNFRKKFKAFVYSRSHRGKMDVLNAKFMEVMRSVQSVKNDISQQIVQLNKQQNELVKQISDVDVKQRKLVNDNYLVLSKQISDLTTYMQDKSDVVDKQISDLATYMQDRSDVVDKQISDLATYVQRRAKIVDENFSKIEEDVGLKSEVLFGQVADLKTIIKSETDKLFKQVQDANNKHQIEILSDKLDVAQAEIVDKTKSVIEHLAGAKSELVNEIDTLHKSGQDANNNIVNQFGMIKSFADVLAKKYSEPYWANVYHDTINNTNWLNNKSVSPGRWAVSYVVLYVLYRILDEIKPQSILECGLGQSSKLTIQYADSHKADLTICENNSDWLAFFQRQFPTADIYTKILDTEMINVVPEYESRTYVGFDNVIKNKKFDLVLIDGPLGSQHYSRPEVLSVVNNLDKSFVILMDDMNRVGEQETFEALKNKLRENNIDFKEGFYESDKKLGLICSPDLEWLTTL